MKNLMLLLLIAFPYLPTLITLQGDLNDDGVVDQSDVFIISDSWKQIAKTPANPLAGTYKFWYRDWMSLSNTVMNAPKGQNGTFQRFPCKKSLDMSI